jgi:hypothetical protein
LPPQLVQCAGELRAEQAEVSFNPFGAPYHHMIGAGKAFGGHDFSGESAQATLHSVADHGAANLLGDGESDAHRRVRVLPITDEQNESGRGCALTVIRGDEVSAPADRD